VVRFLIRLTIGQKTDQSETSFFKVAVFGILMIFYCRLLMAESPNLKTDFRFESPLVKDRPIRSDLFYFKVLRCFSRTFVEVIEGHESEFEVRFFI